MTNAGPFLLTFFAAIAGSAVLVASWPKPIPSEAMSTESATAHADRLLNLERRLQLFEDENKRLEARLEQLTTMRTQSVLAQMAAAAHQEQESVVEEEPAPVLKEAKPVARSHEEIFAALVKGDLSETEARELWAELKAAGKMDAVVAMFEARAKQNPQDADVQTELGSVYLQRLLQSNPGPEQGIYGTKADRAFLAALKINPDHYDARFSRATSLAFWPDLFGKKPEAIREYETLIAQQDAKGYNPPQHAQTYVFLGNLYEQTGKTDLAREIRQKGARIYPDNQELKQRLSR